MTTPRVPKQAKAKLAQNTLDRLRKDKDRRLPENQAVAKEKEGEGGDDEGGDDETDELLMLDEDDDNKEDICATSWLASRGVPGLWPAPDSSQTVPWGAAPPVPGSRATVSWRPRSALRSKTNV